MSITDDKTNPEGIEMMPSHGKAVRDVLCFYCKKKNEKGLDKWL